jgi:hypothetical protein
MDQKLKGLGVNGAVDFNEKLLGLMKTQRI